MQSYILGGGIAGMIAAFYNKDYVLVTDKNLGGQMADNSLGPRLLEVNDNSARLLEDLGYGSVPIKVAKIGYMVNGKYIDRMTPELRLSYYKKSRFLKDVIEVPKSIMSDGKGEIKYFDIDWNELIRRLATNIKTTPIFGKVIRIDTEEKYFVLEDEDIKTEYSYDYLISTLPAPVFQMLSNTEPEVQLTFVPKTFVITSPFFPMGDFDYVYFPGEEVEYHRVTKVPGTDLVAVEYTTTRQPALIGEEWPFKKDLKHLRNGQIQSGSPRPVHCVDFLGRYAAWDHDIKTDDVVEHALSIKEIDDMLNEMGGSGNAS